MATVSPLEGVEWGLYQYLGTPACCISRFSTPGQSPDRRQKAVHRNANLDHCLGVGTQVSKAAESSTPELADWAFSAPSPRKRPRGSAAQVPFPLATQYWISLNMGADVKLCRQLINSHKISQCGASSDPTPVSSHIRLGFYLPCFDQTPKAEEYPRCF